MKTIQFKDYPDFKPNLTPRDIFILGSFGGTYWRDIYSSVCDEKLSNEHLKYPKSWWKDIDNKYLTLPYNKYDVTINKYGVKVGTTLEFWEKKKWINKKHPYGWVQWYCDFYSGKRCDDDKRQINRWLKITGPNGRFKLMLINMIKKSGKKYNDYSVSPKIRQTLQHWGYKLTKQDMN